MKLTVPLTAILMLALILWPLQPALAQAPSPVPSQSAATTAPGAATSTNPMDREPGASALRELKAHLDYLGGLQSAPLQDTVSISPDHPAWPGMNRFDVIEGLRVLAQAQVVVLLSLDGTRQAIWIKHLRGYRKANGWYGIRINDQEIDESRLYVMYGGREINFQGLMTWGSRQTPGDSAFIIEP